MQHLPCRRAACGRWVHVAAGAGRRWRASAFVVHRVRWNFAEAVVHPFPWRSARGGVYFPARGDGWVWHPEYVAMLRQGLRRHVVRLESWEWRRSARCRHRRPLAWVARWYRARLAAKRRGDAAEHAIKLALNSLYGKTAQRVGAIPVGDGWRLPPHHDLCAAGWITSRVRAQLYLAACQNPSAVCMLATDAIFSTAPLALNVSTRKTLGAWTFTKHTGATIVQSGVYFVDDVDGSALYSRGFDASSVRRAAILRAWRLRRMHVQAAQSRFVGLGRALAGLSAFGAWRTWTREPRALALHPWGTKRTPPHDATGKAPDASRGLVTTRPTDTRALWDDIIGGRGRLTTPSAVPWRQVAASFVVPLDQHDRADDESEDATL